VSFDTDALISRLQRFVELKERPTLKIAQDAIDELMRLRIKVQYLEKEAQEKLKQAPAPQLPITSQNLLRVQLWERFPPIPASSQHRTECSRCGTPMRATLEMCAEIMRGYKLLCETCDPYLLLPKEWSITPRQRQSLDVDPEESKS
jgi:hypothetical protein